MSDHMDLLRRLAVILDAMLPEMDRMAAAEKRREAGKSLQCITNQKRRDMARIACKEAGAVLGMPELGA